MVAEKTQRLIRFSRDRPEDCKIGWRTVDVLNAVSGAKLFPQGKEVKETCQSFE